MNTPAMILDRTLDQFTDVLRGVTDPEALTPCDDWRAIDVAGHVVGTMGKVIALVTGADLAASPADPHLADLTPDTLLARWEERVAQVRQALATADLDVERTTAYGSGPVGRQLAVPACDLAVHAWDVATSQGHRLELPQAVREFLHAVVATIPPERLRAPGMFGPEAPAPVDANDTERIMAFLGRVVPRS